jgi:hypothetical protein
MRAVMHQRLLLRVVPSFLIVAVCEFGFGCSSSPAHQDTPTFNFAWDWTGIVGTGQSLSVGALGTPVIATQQPYGNLKLAFGGAAVAPPFDPTNASLTVEPLTEPMRPFASSYPSAYPANLYGETLHTAMANQLTAMAMSAAAHDHVSIPTVVGESGQPMTVIKKDPNPADLPTTGTSGRAYDATLFEASALTRLAGAAGKTYGIGAIVMTHGESDAGNNTYGSDLYQLLTDYNADLLAITGQTAKIPMLVSQQDSVPSDTGSVSVSALQVQKAGVDHPGEIVCTGPKYQYSYATDSAHVHLSAQEYERVGEKTAQVYFERVVMGHDWQPLQPTSGEVNGDVVTVHFHVPVPPLTWDAASPPPHATKIAEWAAGRGFELTAAGVRKTITGVEIVGDDSVKLTRATDLSGLQVVVGYAATAEGDTLPADRPARWGHLRDSDPFMGSVTGSAQPNYCVAFQMTL